MSKAPLVLAIEPDLRQASIVKRIVREHVQADVTVVDSKDAAMEAIRATIPDVLLISALLSPRDEDDLMSHLRTLEGASHLQTHTIPQLASTLAGDERESKGGLFSAFRRKKNVEATPAGCDPELFADEIRLYLERATTKKRETAEFGVSTPLPIARPRGEAAPQAAPEEAAEQVAGASWASPFEWRPSQKYAAPTPAPASASPVLHPSFEIPNPPSAIADSEFDPGSPIPDLEFHAVAEAAQIEPPIEPLAAAPEPVFVEPEPVVLAPEPVVVAAPEPLVIPEPVVVPEPVRTPEPVFAKPRLTVVAPPEIEVVLPARARKADATPRESKRRTLEAWAHLDVPAGDAPEPNGELRALLSGLGVPDSIASITYPRGVRIRRVRVRASREAAAGHGPIVAAKRLLAELRDDARA